MKYINSSFEEFNDSLGNRKIILFGATNNMEYYFLLFQELESLLAHNTIFCIDNSVKKQGKKYKVGEFETDIQSFEYLKKYILLNDDVVVLIASALCYHLEIIEQLNTLKREIDCYSLPLMTYSSSQSDNSAVDLYYQTHKEPKIPPIIHCLWFSGDEKPELYARCIESWRKTNPQLEIKEWNSENYDVTKNKYLYEAYVNKKWAFVSDYARLDLIYHYGGIYLDMDVELLANIEHLLNADCFMCRQQDGLIEPGSGFGAVKGHELVGRLLHSYDNRSLIMENGEIDMTALPSWLGPYYSEYGIGQNHNSEIVKDVIILSNDYIHCGSISEIKDCTLGIHWHNAGWLSDTERENVHNGRKMKASLGRMFIRN